VNIITEHAYQAARWGDAEFDAILSKELKPSDIIDMHNGVVITLQGDHDAEVEKLRHTNADLLRDLHYARDGRQKVEEKMKRMSDTIRRLGEQVKKLEGE
jgi:L-ascorbate metabolism protein UlaG (beta-lactamase superfamily)